MPTAPAAQSAGRARVASLETVLARVARLVPVLVGLASFALGYRALYFGHPHEDAFILFEYARHVAAGDGIVFWTGGPHAEGATDFLWMLLLAASVKLGIDVAVAACIWNALGAWLASTVLVRVATRSGARGAWLLVLALGSGAVLASAAAVAASAGFSTLAYGALALLLADVALDADARRVRWAPLVALVVALFRPDGVGLALAFGAAGALVARHASAPPSLGARARGRAMHGSRRSRSSSARRTSRGAGRTSASSSRSRCTSSRPECRRSRSRTCSSGRSRRSRAWACTSPG